MLDLKTAEETEYNLVCPICETQGEMDANIEGDQAAFIDHDGTLTIDYCNDYTLVSFNCNNCGAVVEEDLLRNTEEKTS
mgnify:CR=1 FL=1